MDYRYLKAFLLTATYQSFSKAALELNIAQSAVSRQVKLLEESLGQELIIRNSKRMVLTTKGKEIFLAIKQFDSTIYEMVSQEAQAPIKIGALQGLFHSWFPPRLTEIAKQLNNPIELIAADINQLKEQIETGTLDIIFSTQNIQSDLLSSLRLFKEKFYLISNFEFNRRQLHESPWIVYGPHDNLFKLSKKPSKKIHTIQSMDMIVHMVQEGHGLAVVPDHLIEDELEQFHYMDISSSIPAIEIFMTTLNFKKLPDVYKTIFDIVTT